MYLNINAIVNVSIRNREKHTQRKIMKSFDHLLIHKLKRTKNGDVLESNCYARVSVYYIVLIYIAHLCSVQAIINSFICFYINV